MPGLWRAVARLSSLLLVVAAGACIPTHTIQPGPASPPAREACFKLRNVDSFTPLHGRYVYVRVRSDEHYLLTLDSIYPHLKTASGIAIEGGWGTICSDTGAVLVFADYDRPVRCRIIKVEAVESKDAAQRLVEERTTPRPKG
jgi:hypothetical protein